MNLKEILSFLKIDKSTPDIENLASTLWQEVEKNAVKRYRVVPFSVINPPFKLIGEDIKNHLRGCKEGYLFVATLGSSIDTLIKKTQLKSMRDAVVLDAVASSYLESFCDEICKELNKKLTLRFSPGYGDFPLEIQPYLLKAAGADKIGVSNLESLMMVPSKTVSAIIGIKE